jgi:3-oxoacyl-[acyl-carrier protein] reductase
MATNLSSKTALVTGASRGIGRAAALALAAAGAQVIVHYGRNAEQAKAVVDEIRREGGRADEISADLAAPKGPHALAEQLRKRVGERLDILVLNAGISNHTPFEEMTVEEFDALFAVNVRAPYFLVSNSSQCWAMAAPSSFSLPSARASPLARCRPMRARKALLIHSSNTLRWRLALAVSASTLWRPESSIPICRISQKTEDGRTAVKGMQALKRIGRPEDVAAVIAFLASDDARWITGDTIAVDGGSRI